VIDVAERLEELRNIRDRMFADYNQLLGMIAAYEEMSQGQEEEKADEADAAGG